MNGEVSSFVATLLHSVTNAHFMHWATDSFSEHMALGEYYVEMAELVDKYAEAYMGRYEQLKEFPSDYYLGLEPVPYLTNIQKFVQEARQHLPQDTELQNLVDEIADQINSTLYKLRMLK